MNLTNNFQTQNGTIYTIDPINKTVCGGHYCPIPQKFKFLDMELGKPATIILENGSFFKTSPIQAFNVEQNKNEVQIITLYTKNSTYYLDYENMLISGGKLQNPIPFLKIDFTGIGNPAKIYLSNGQIMATSSIVAFEQKFINSNDKQYQEVDNDYNLI